MSGTALVRAPGRTAGVICQVLLLQAVAGVAAGADPDLIVTVRGAGYRLRGEPVEIDYRPTWIDGAAFQRAGHLVAEMAIGADEQRQPDGHCGRF